MARRKKPADEPDMEQGYIPGTEPPRVPAVDQAAKLYHKVMLDRVELTKEEHEAMANLVEKMIEAGLQYYETKQGLEVKLTSKSKCTVKPAKKKHPTDDNESTS
jgi:hypothetical protein